MIWYDMNEWFVELLDRAPPTQLRRAAQDIASHILLAYGPRCSMGQSCGRMPAVKRCPGWCVNFLGLNMEKQCHIPPMTGNGLYPTYLWWFVGMVVIIVLHTVNFYGWSPIWKPINQRLFHERYFEWLNGWEGSRSDRGRLGIPICLLRLGCPSPLQQGP